MEYPKIKVPRNCFIITKPNHQSPRVQLSGNDKHLAWITQLQEQAEKNAKEPHSPPSEAPRLRMFWQTVAFFAERLRSGGLAVQVWNIRGEMSRHRNFSEEAFKKASRALFKVD